MAGMEDFIKKVPLFRGLEDGDIKAIAKGLHRQSFKKGDTIFQQGESGDSFYILAVGAAEVLMHPLEHLQVNDVVVTQVELTFAGKQVPKGSLARVDKYDAARDYPYTVRLQDPKFGGQRGRVLPEEIQLSDQTAPDQHVAWLRPGDYFGEQTLLKQKPRNATVKATENMDCGVIDAKLFESLDLGHKLHFHRRHAIKTFTTQKEPGGEVTKSEADMKLVLDSILANQKLTEIVQLDEVCLEGMVAAAWKKSTMPGEVVINQGSIDADEFFVVKDGEFEVQVAPSGSGEDKAHAGKVVGSLTSGASFGELALLNHAPRAATVMCKKAGTLFVIDRFTFKDALRKASQARTDKYLKILDAIRLFDCLLAEEKETLANHLVETHYLTGETIMREGEMGKAFYILEKGTIAFTKKDPADAEEKVISFMDAAKPEKGCYFGERSLLRHEARGATARVTSQEAVCLALSKDHFEEMLGSLADLIKESESSADKQRKPKTTQPAKERDMKTIKQADLKSLGLLGCGGFGAVTLEQHKQTGAVYALKKLSKGFIVKTKMQEGTMREKKILAMCDSNFIIKLHATFKDSQFLYLVLEPAMGGELYATYHKHRFHGDVVKARFYSGSVVFCFEHLHSMNVLYRDLKPENLLLDGEGMCKMTDMGLAKVVPSGKTYTTCGTPDYFAPEVVQQSGMGRGADWWTLGVLTHELLSGHAPFEANDPMETYQKIVRGITRVRFSYKDPEAQDYVRNMLKHQPVERLPMQPGGTKNVKTHPWFKSFNWETLGDRTMVPPFRPNVKSATDTSNFKASEADLPPNVPYKDDGSNWDADF